MSRFPVALEKERALLELMQKLGLLEQDLEERFVKSSGPGGQKMNKTSSCVMLCHVPSGIMVKAGQSRSQALNRFLARRLLCEKYQTALLGSAAPDKQQRARRRKQKERRARRRRQREGR